MQVGFRIYNDNDHDDNKGDLYKSDSSSVYVKFQNFILSIFSIGILALLIGPESDHWL